MFYLTAQLSLPLPREEVFAFFSDAGNLALITPPEVGFTILSPQPISMAPGTLIDYQIKLFGVPMQWQTLITRWEPPYLFADEQRRGPYKTWVHTHRFHERDGATIIEDEVAYSLPLWPLGAFAFPLVQLQLQRIFAYREQAIRAHFHYPAT